MPRTKVTAHRPNLTTGDGMDSVSSNHIKTLNEPEQQTNNVPCTTFSFPNNVSETSKKTKVPSEMLHRLRTRYATDPEYARKKRENARQNYERHKEEYRQRAREYYRRQKLIAQTTDDENFTKAARLRMKYALNDDFADKKREYMRNRYKNDPEYREKRRQDARRRYMEKIGGQYIRTKKRKSKKDEKKETDNEPTVSTQNNVMMPPVEVTFPGCSRCMCVRCTCNKEACSSGQPYSTPTPPNPAFLASPPPFPTSTPLPSCSFPQINYNQPLVGPRGCLSAGTLDYRRPAYLCPVRNCGSSFHIAKSLDTHLKSHNQDTAPF